MLAAEVLDKISTLLVYDNGTGIGDKGKNWEVIDTAAARSWTSPAAHTGAKECTDILKK